MTQGVQTHVTQNQLDELLESEAAKTMLETGEQRGWIEPAELESFAVEHGLADTDIDDLARELDRIGLEVREGPSEGKTPRRPRTLSTRPTSSWELETAFSSSWPRSEGTSS